MAKDIYDNIDDVKCSLDNAQQSFRKNNGLRGELDLMLAEASIRYLREKRGLVSVWNRQKLAAILAVLLVLAGYGGWLYAGVSHDEAVNIPSAAAVAPAQKQTVAVPQQTVTTQPEPEIKQPVPAEQNINSNTSYKNYLAEEDMQQLVRTGRQVLQDAD